MNKFSMFELNEELEATANEIISSPNKIAQVELLSELDHLANTIQMIKREITHTLIKDAIENEWYDAFTLNKRAYRKHL